MTSATSRITHRAVSPAALGTAAGSITAAAALRRSWRWIAGPALAASLVALAAAQAVPPTYSGSARILLEADAAAGGREPAGARLVESQTRAASARSLAREAVRRLKLAGNPDFDPDADGIGTGRRFLMMIGLVPNTLAQPADDRVLEAFQERLAVHPAGEAGVLAVDFSAHDSGLAAQGANTVAELYLTALEAARAEGGEAAEPWLDAAAETLRTRLAEAEAKVEGFRARNGLAPTQGSGAQRLAELQAQVVQIRAQQADFRARAKHLDGMLQDGRAFEIPDVSGSEVLRRFAENRMNLRAQLSRESRILLPAHPRMKELTAQVADSESQLKAAAERFVRSLENDARIAETRADSLQATVGSQGEAVARGADVQLRALERVAQEQRAQLEAYLARHRESAAREARVNLPAGARLVVRATPAEAPASPNVLATVLAAGVVTALAALAAVLLRHRMAGPDRDTKRAGRPAGRLLEPAVPFMPSAPAAFDVMADTTTGNAAPETEAEDGAPRLPFVFPEAASAAAWETAGVVPAPGHTGPVLVVDAGPLRLSPPDATAPARPAFDLSALIVRLNDVAVTGPGRAILVVEAAGPAGGDSLAITLAERLAENAPTLLVELNDRSSDEGALGFSDLVAGEAPFLDVIQPVAGAQRQRVAAGLAESDVLLDEPVALSISIEAMAVAYTQVVCRLVIADPALSQALVAATAMHMDGVVIAGDALDAVTVEEIYGIAEDAEAGVVLVAQESETQESDAQQSDAPAAVEPVPEDEMELRLQAA